MRLSVYERFEQVIALVIALLVAVVIVVAVWRDRKVFQVVFGRIATVLIAREFKHSIVKVIAAREHIG